MSSVSTSFIYEQFDHLFSGSRYSPNDGNFEQNKCKNNVIQIDSILRYMSDSISLLKLGKECGDILYDLVISDGSFRIKCFLEPSLYSLITQGTLFEGTFVELNSYDIMEEYNGPVIVVTALSIYECDTYQDRSSSNLLTNRTKKKKCLNFYDSRSFFHPIMADRSYYLSLYNDDEPLQCDPSWHQEISTVNDLSNYPGLVPQIISISDIAGLKIDGKYCCKNEIILCKILAKSKLNHYGKPKARTGSWPWQFLILAGDQSGVVQCVFWNDLCKKFFYQLKKDDVLLLINFRIKERIVDITPGFSYELSFNPSDSERCIRKINPSVLSKQFVDFHLNLSEEKNIFSSFFNEYEDLEGLIIYCGPISRESSFGSSIKNAKTYSQIKKFSQCRWIHMIKESSLQEISIKVYSCSNLTKLEQLETGQWVKLTNLKRISGITIPNQMIIYASSYMTEYTFQKIRSNMEVSSYPPVLISEGFYINSLKCSKERVSFRSILEALNTLEIQETVELKTLASVNQICIRPILKNEDADIILHHILEFISNIPSMRKVIRDPHSNKDSSFHLNNVSGDLRETFNTSTAPVSIIFPSTNGNDKDQMDLPMICLHISEPTIGNLTLTVIGLGRLSQINISSFVDSRSIFIALLMDIMNLILSHMQEELPTRNNIERILENLKGKVFEMSLILWKKDHLNNYIFVKEMTPFDDSSPAENTISKSSRQE